MESKKFDKNKILAVGVTVLLVVFFIGGFLIGLDRVSSMEGTYPEPQNPDGVMPPVSNEEALGLLESLIEKARKDKPMMNVSNDFSVNSDSVSTTSSDEFRAVLLFISDNFTDSIASASFSNFEKTSTKYNEDFSDAFRYPDITADEIDVISDNMRVFTCLSCGASKNPDEENSEPPARCEDCGSQRAYFEKYRDVFTVDLVLKTGEAPFVEDSVLNRNFMPRTSEEIQRLMEDKIKGVATIGLDAQNDILYKSLRISFSFDRIKEELHSVKFIKEMTINADVLFEGEYSVFGSQEITFDLTETVSYSFTWPGLSLSASEMTIEPGKSDNLLATLTCDDPLAYEVTWKSSDESIATVDSEGYIDASDTPGTAVITAEFTFNGKTYSDECTVFVRTPVESVKMSQKSAQLNVGETLQLEITVSPKKASKDCRWHSENEAVATVDENGVVTAIAPGEVIIFAVTNDGDFKSTCEVSVK